jgi:lipoprotein NlpD
MNRVLRTGLLAAAIGLLAACGVAPRAVVVDRAPQDRSPSRQTSAAESGRTHVVQRGDTLYSIAFRHGLEYRQVAAWNGIASPYTIYPGQRLRLSAPGGRTAQRPATLPTRPAAQQGGVVAGTAATNGASPATPATGSAPSTGATAGTRTPAPVTSTPTTAPAPVASTPRPTPPTPTGAPRWQWPTSGQVVGRFVAGDPTRQGLSIAGSAGQAVNAAADGVVVYSGSGLIGYGELVIVKHNEEFLSAYGHNRKRLVGEGEQVRAGQQIAEMGRSGAARDMLHFEIRRNGRPVNPGGFLPAR